MGTYTFRGGYIEDEGGDRCWSQDLVSNLEHERAKARAEVERLKQELAMAQQVSGELCDECGWAMKFPGEPCRCKLEKERDEARNLLANIFDRYACAACSHGKTSPDCPCGFHAAGAYLDRTEKP
jgi:hypothetical protein